MQTHWLRTSILTVLLLAAVMAGVQAATVVVAPSGGDYSALQPAVDAASPGDTVEVRPGAYPGGVVVRTPVTIIGTEGVTIGAGGEAAALIIEADGVTVRGLACDGPDIGIIANASESSRIGECNLIVGDTGILFSGCRDCSVADTSILSDVSGLLVMSSEQIDIGDSFVNGGASGVTLRDVRVFALRQTALLGCDVGVVAERCGNGTIEAMTFTDVDAGLLGIGCTDVLVSGSMISNQIQYQQMYNGLRCRVEADTMEGAEYFAADIFSDTTYACGPWTVSGWNYALERVDYDAPEDYTQFGDALNVTFIDEAESLTDPFLLMEAEVPAADLEGYAAETFGIYQISGETPIPAGTAATVTVTAPGEYALLAKMEQTGPDLFDALIGILVLIGIVFLIYIIRRR